MTPIAFLSDVKWALAIVIILDSYKFIGMHNHILFLIAILKEEFLNIFK